MTKEQEAIENIKIYIHDYISESVDEDGYTQYAISEEEQEFFKDIDTVLNMLKEKDKEIEKLKADNKKAWKLNANMSQRHLSDIFKIKKKDKIIDLMTEYISKIDIEEEVCMKNKTNPEWCNEDYTNCKNCIKQYFEKLAKEKGE